MTTIQIGADDQPLARVTLSPDGLVVQGETTADETKVRALLATMRRGRYAEQDDATFLADLPHRLRSRVWAQVVEE